MSVQYVDKNGRPDPARKFDTWEDWVEFHDEQHRNMADMLPAIGKFVRKQIDEATKPLQERITELEWRLSVKAGRDAA